jgi:hypothetical protein
MIVCTMIWSSVDQGLSSRWKVMANLDSVAPVGRCAQSTTGAVLPLFPVRTSPPGISGLHQAARRMSVLLAVLSR